MAATSIFDGGNPIDPKGGSLALFLLQLIIVMSMCRLISIPLAKIGQPKVIGEVIVGILLGPSVMSTYIPGFKDTIFPTSSLPFLAIVANLGLILFLFLVGLELDPKTLKEQAKKAIATSIGGIILPFALGCAVSWLIYETYMTTPTVLPNGTTLPPPPFPSFLAFLGVAMSITAFPVLARILTERQLLQTPVGIATISAAAVDDVVAWTLLAIVVSVVNATSLLTSLWIFLSSAAWALIVLFIVKPLLRKMVLFTESANASDTLFGRWIPISELSTFVMFLFVFVSSFITEILGIHAIFGAFLAGIACPHDYNFAIRLTEKVEDLVTLVLLPLYFTASGLRTQIGLLNDGQAWGFVVLVTTVACVGKILGCGLASKFSGMTWRESATVGFLMNTRGLVELIVLNLGLDANVINVKVFTIMVLMALITTFMTCPIVALIYPTKYWIKTQEPLDSPEKPPVYTVDASINPNSLLETSSILVNIPPNNQPTDGLFLVAKSMSQPSHYATSRPKHLFTEPNPTKIHVLRLFELDNRMSSVGLASVAAFQTSQTIPPTTSSIQSLTEQPTLDNQFDYFVSYAAKPTWSDELVARAVQKKVGWILLLYPYQQPNLLQDESYHVPKDAMQLAVNALNVTSHGGVGEGVVGMTILIDRGLTSSSPLPPLTSSPTDITTLRRLHYRRIVLVFQGGVDDRAGLALMARFANNLNFQVYVLKISQGDDRDESCIEQLKSDPAIQVLQGDEILQFLPGYQKESLWTELANVLTSRDLLVVGRKVPLKYEGVESLGVMAGDALTMTNASILVVQGRVGTD